MTEDEQITEQNRIDRELAYELAKAKINLLQTLSSTKNAYSTVAMTQAFAHLEGTLTSSTAIQHN